jgi:hypothetical protein
LVLSDVIDSGGDDSGRVRLVDVPGNIVAE